jgi:dienelactone hydrolase
MPSPLCLKVDPLLSLLDEEVDISVTGLKPHEEVSIRSSMYDEEGRLWSSSALFKADSHGNIRVGDQAPLKGHYQHKDKMGLFWSMDTPQAGHVTAKTLAPLSVDFLVEGTKAACRITRLKIAYDIQRREIQEKGVVGTYFFRKGQKRLPALLILGGAEGGIKENRGALLASHGFATLVLAYFGAEGTPRHLKEIPVECVQRGAEWLKKQPEVDPDHLLLFGSSRGAELALLSASLYPQLFNALVAYVPSCAVYGSLPEMKGNAWLYQGKPIAPPAPFPFPLLTEGKPLVCTPSFLAGMEDPHFEQSVIPVEKIQCPLLLISGEADGMWPSSIFCKKIMDRLEKYHSPIVREHLCYAGAGHHINIPYLPSTHSVVFHSGIQTWVDFGGIAEPHAQASCDAWKNMIRFLSHSR